MKRKKNGGPKPLTSVPDTQVSAKPAAAPPTAHDPSYGGRRDPPRRRCGGGEGGQMSESSDLMGIGRRETSLLLSPTRR